MYNVIEEFLKSPCEKTFSRIKNNTYLLLKLFRKNKNLAKQFFSQDEWSLIEKEATDLSIKEQKIVKTALKK